MNEPTIGVQRSFERPVCSAEAEKQYARGGYLTPASVERGTAVQETPRQALERALNRWMDYIESKLDELEADVAELLNER